MAGGYGQRMRLRLFIEGVEVPVIAAQVQVNPNSPAAASIQIPPLGEGTRIKPRSIVHLYFLDFYEVQSPFASPAGATNTASNQSPNSYKDSTTGTGTSASASSTTGDPESDFRNAKYKLLFGGEVVGLQWTKNQSQRSLVLQCQDWSNYWDYAQQWNNTDLFGPGIKALFSGGSTNLFTDFLSDEGSAIIQILQTPSIQYPNLQGLLGGVVHLLESIGGSYYYGETIAGDNIFFSLAELRLHITQMITAYEQDPTASRLLSAGYDSLLGRTLGNLGQQVSIRQAINALMGIVFHETYAQCCPLYVPGSGNSPSGQSRNSVRTDPDNAFIATTADALLQSITQIQAILSVPQPPGTSPAAAQASILTSLSAMRATCSDVAGRITGAAYLPARSFYSTALTNLGTAQAAARSWTPGTNANVISAVNAALTQAQTQLTQAAGFEVISSTSKATPSRLNQQIFRPDVWFSAPPRCNVIFPEHYHTLTYSRAFLQEPTRLLLKTNDEFYGEDELFDQFYFAPKGFTLKTGGKELEDILNNGILDHELYKGILPVFEKMGELNIFNARSGATPSGAVPKIGLAQRTTNFLYFKYLFGARQLQLTGKFNPYLACGFPALIVDKYVDAASLALRQQMIQQNGGVVTTDMNRLLGTHFLANLTEVAHSVSQNSGETSLNCSYARQPDEGTEFLGVTRPNQQIQQRAAQDASRQSVVAAISPPAVGSLGPNNGPLTAVQEVSQAYKGQSLPLYQGPSIAGTAQPSISVAIGLTQAASAYSAAVATYIANPAQVVTFRAFKVTESVPRYSRETATLPMEEYIRPGWYGDIWHPSLIGQAYQQFFQTGAITDQQQVDAPNGASVGVPYAQARAALQQAAKATSADDPAAAAPGLLALDTDTSVEAAVAFIVQTYSYVKQQGLDVDDFIRAYTWRPIASMVDMFGTSNLALDASGVNVVSGIEGFHSRAFGPYNNLFGLTTPDITSILGIQRSTTAAQRGDKRLEKQQAVQEYVAALSFARAILG